MTALSSSLRQTQGQRLTLTPSLRQALALLQLSSTELLLHVDSELALNPLLELEDEAFDPGVVQEQPNIEPEALPFDDPVGIQADFGRSPSALSWAETLGQIESDLPGEYDGLAEPLSLTDSLMQQLGCLSVSEDQKQLVAWLIGNLNDDGLFDDSFESLIQECPMHAEQDLWRCALDTLQSLDPCGIGVFNRTQSLVLQLRRHVQLHPDDETSAQLAVRILESFPDLLARHDSRSLARACSSSEVAVQKACDLIGTLNPRPTAAFAVTAHCGYIIPDVLVSKTVDGWRAEINPQTVPPLRFNQAYFDLLTQAKLSVDGEAEWRQKATQARTLIHSLEHRFSTLISVAQTIVRIQSNFFEHGPSALVPMTLRDIADQLQIAESTVSRATADKYLQCPQGTFELKYFFTSSLSAQDGSTISSMTARRRIKELVSQENPLKPLSDAALANLLQKEGIELARRTVAKYREMENIAPKALRKRSVPA